METAIVNFIVVTAAALVVLDIVIPRNKILSFKSYVETAWINIEYLSVSDFSLLFINNFRLKLKNIHGFVLKAFLLSSLAVASSYLIIQILHPSLDKDVHSALSRFGDSDLRLSLNSISYQQQPGGWPSLFWIDDLKRCKTVETSEGINISKDFYNKIRINSILADNKPLEKNRLSYIYILSDIVVIFIMTMMSLISLYISLVVTDYLLKSINLSARRLYIYVFLDIILAFLIPVIVTSTVFSAIFGFISPTRFNFEKFSDQEYIFTFLFTLKYSMIMNFFPFDHLSLWGRVIVERIINEPSSFSLLWYFLKIFYLIVSTQLSSYIESMMIVFRFDFMSIAYNQSIYNYLFSFSIIYSLIYIISMTFIVACSKYTLIREMTLNSLNYITEHEKGPIAAIAAFIGGLAVIAQKILS